MLFSGSTDSGEGAEGAPLQPGGRTDLHPLDFKLCDLAARFDPFFAELKDAVKTLDYYYVEARYPNALQDVIPAEFYSARDAAEAIRMVTDVHRAVGERLAFQDKMDD